MNWPDIILDHPIIKDFRLKKLNVKYPYDVIHAQVDIVDWESFIIPETDRLPLLIVNRAGLWPKAIQYEILFAHPRQVVLLHVHYLTSFVGGCEIYNFPRAFDYRTLEFPKQYEKYKVKGNYKI